MRLQRRQPPITQSCWSCYLMRNPELCPRAIGSRRKCLSREVTRSDLRFGNDVSRSQECKQFLFTEQHS